MYKKMGGSEDGTRGKDTLINQMPVFGRVFVHNPKFQNVIAVFEWEITKKK